MTGIWLVSGKREPEPVWLWVQPLTLCHTFSYLLFISSSSSHPNPLCNNASIPVLPLCLNDEVVCLLAKKMLSTLNVDQSCAPTIPQDGAGLGDCKDLCNWGTGLVHICV